MDVAVNFAALTKQTGVSQGGHLSGHVGPTELGTDQAASGTHPRMGDAVERVKGGLLKSGRQERTKRTCGDVTKKIRIVKSPENDGEVG